MVRHISNDELVRLLDKSVISQSDRFLIDSNIDTPLVEFCGDLRPNEIEKARNLEEKNIYRYLNATSIILGLYGQDSLVKALTTSPVSDMVVALKEEYFGQERIQMSVRILPKVLLALGSREIAKPHFEGEMPQKFMSFRNQTAQDWYEKIINRKLAILSTIYIKGSAEEAKAHLLASVAYHLNNSNPSKYPFVGANQNDALKNIVVKFINDVGGDTRIVYSNNGEVLSKSL